MLFMSPSSVAYKNVAMGGKLSFQNVRRGGKGVHDVLTLQNSRGGKSSPGGGGKGPHIPKCSPAISENPHKKHPRAVLRQLQSLLIYHIAGFFRGRKLSRISRFCGDLCKFFFRENLFSSN